MRITHISECSRCAWHRELYTRVSLTPEVTGTIIASILQKRTLGFEELLEMAQSQAVVFVCLFSKC